MAKKHTAQWNPATRIILGSSHKSDDFSTVTSPVFHASTITQETLDDYRNSRGKYDYGRVGTPTSDAFEHAVATLYDMDDCVSVPSGLSAIHVGISAIATAGDEVLLPDSLYGPGRIFADQVLPQMGVKPVYYDPTAEADVVKKLVTDKTSLVYIESPGSLTFDMQDIPKITAMAHQAGCLVACDNTWGTALHFDPKSHDIDVVIEAGTKYINGHSDVNIGIVVSSGKTAATIRRYARRLGLCVAPDDLYLATRGIKTMAVRLKQSEQNGIAIASFLSEQSEVLDMLHPALPSHPGHHHWSRDFTGSCGLFGFTFRPEIPYKAIDAMVNNLDLFDIGQSWGGCKSLMTQSSIKRTIIEAPQGALMRVYAGIEDIDDLITDLSLGFERLRAAC